MCVLLCFFNSSILKCGMKYSNQTWCVHLLFLYLSPLSKACSLLPGKYRNISLYIWRHSWGHSGITFLGLMCNEPVKSACSSEVFGNICWLFCNSTFLPHHLQLYVFKWDSSVYWCYVVMFSSRTTAKLSGNFGLQNLPWCVLVKHAPEQ